MKSPHNIADQLKLPFPDMSNTFADFFSGCGGMSLGFIQAGMKCISAMDFDLAAVQTYWRNLCLKGWSHLWVDGDDQKLMRKLKNWKGETDNWLFEKLPTDEWLTQKTPSPCLNLFCGSILDMEPEQWMERCEVSPGDIRVFIGGPPCQGFSTANTSRSEYDERNRLPLRFIYYAKVCRPDYVVMENVPGLLSLGKQKGDAEGPFVRWIREAFHEAGYDMTYQKVNAADFGVPQMRKRVIFMANRKGVTPVEHPQPTYGTPENPYVTVREAIGDLPPIQAGEIYDGEPYGYDPEPGHVICPYCLRYNQDIRKACWNCGEDLSQPFRGGVYRGNGFLLLNTGNPTRKEIIK